jgi:A/G-specific adenine glycosylase
MLQQTQVDRVVPKYHQFLNQYPQLKDLARSDTKSLLTLWQGLGYNNRALRLRHTAQIITDQYHGHFPQTQKELQSLPGIGPAIAGDLLAFAWNLPVVVIETNIRTVYIHHFFKPIERVTDTQLHPLVEATLDRNHPREWYWALFDYGSYLKSQGLGKLHQSQSYRRQTPFQGSNRQLRSAILKHVLEHGPLTKKELLINIQKIHPQVSVAQIDHNLSQLTKEGLIHQSDTQYLIS